MLFLTILNAKFVDVKKGLSKKRSNGNFVHKSLKKKTSLSAVILTVKIQCAGAGLQYSIARSGPRKGHCILWSDWSFSDLCATIRVSLIAVCTCNIYR